MNNILEENIAELFGFDEMTEEEKMEFLDGVGSVIMESAFLRFLATQEEEIVESFQKALENANEDEQSLETLMEQYPDFAQVLEEEVAAFKQEAVAVLK